MAGIIWMRRPEPSWSIGSHRFYWVVDRIRAAAPEACKALVEPLFLSIDEGSDFIDLDEAAPEAFEAFYRVARQGYRRFIASEDEARAFGPKFPEMVEAWGELIGLLEADERCPRD